MDTLLGEPIGVCALILTLCLAALQSEFINDKFRNRLVVEAHSSDGFHTKCRIYQLKIDNNTEKILRNIQIDIVRDYLVNRGDLQDLSFSERSNAMLSTMQYMFPDRPSLEVPFVFKNNALVIPELHPGKWLDIVADYSHQDIKIEEIRSKFGLSDGDYFTPRIASVSSSDGTAIVDHHDDSCLEGEYRISDTSWRFW